MRRQSVASHVTTVVIQSLLRMSSRKCSKESAPIRTRTGVRDERPLRPPTTMSLIWNCTGEGRRGRNCECYISILLFIPLSRHLPSSSPPHPSPKISLAFLCFFCLSLLVLNFPVFGVFLYVRNNLIFYFLTKFMSVADVTLGSSAMDGFVRCSVRDNMDR